jgi:hypothetical protein
MAELLLSSLAKGTSIIMVFFSFVPFFYTHGLRRITHIFRAKGYNQNQNVFIVLYHRVCRVPIL